MGWFNKKKKEEKKETPSLAELPKLPELPKEKMKDLGSIHKLPSFPNDSFGKKISQDTIKEAVTGKKEERDAFEENKMKRHPEEMGELPYEKEIPHEFQEAAQKVKSAEPIFIRIDKFEEGLKIFDKIKSQITDIEKMLREIKEIKEKEEQELQNWESEIKKTKEQIEKIDKDIFSKIE